MIMSIKIGTASNSNAILDQGSFIVKEVSGEIQYFTPVYPWPCTTYRKSLNYPPDMYFLPGESSSDLKLIRVEPDNTPDFRTFLEGINPETDQSYADDLGIDLSVITDLEIIAQIPSGFEIEISDSFTEVEDPLITSIFNAIEAIRSPIQKSTIAKSSTGVLLPYRNQQTDAVLLSLLIDRDSSYYPFYLSGSYTFTTDMLNYLQTGLNYTP